MYFPFWAYTNSHGGAYFAQPPDDTQRKASTIDSLAPHERLFLRFEMRNIHRSLRFERVLTYLPGLSSTIEANQKEFQTWLNKEHSSQQFDSKELDVTKIALSIWEKTKKFQGANPDSDVTPLDADRMGRLFPERAVFSTGQTVVMLNTITEIEGPSFIRDCIAESQDLEHDAATYLSV